jgi:hypothetical protein
MRRRAWAVDAAGKGVGTADNVAQKERAPVAPPVELRLVEGRRMEAMEHLSIQRASVLLHGAAKGSVDQVVGVLFVVGGKVSIKGGFEQGNRCFGVICARHGLFEPVGRDRV